MIADDLDGVLVGADGAVAAETPELALDGAFGRRVRAIGVLGKREVGDVVDDAHRKLAARLVLGELFVNGKRAGRRRVLRAQTVAAADDLQAVDAPFLHKCVDDVQEQRLALGARLLRAVHDGDLLDRGRQCLDELGRHEWAVQANLDQADLLAVCVQVVDDLFDDVAERAHGHDDAVGIGRAVVVEQLVVGAELGVDFVHVLLDDGRQRVVVGVASLAVLEEDVAVLVAAAHRRMVGVKGVLAERLHGVHVAHLCQVVVVPHGDLLNLVRGAEAVEEVQERNLALDGGQVRDGRKVHDLLYVALGEHRETGLAARHDVGVVAEDVQRVRGDGARRHVEDARQLLSGDLVHVGNHQQQTLAGRIGAGERTGAQRSVDCARGACLGFHLADAHRGAEDVLLALGCPLVYVIGHRARRRNGVNTRHLGKCVRDVRRGVVAIHGFELTCHTLSLLVASRFRSRPPRMRRPGDGMRSTRLAAMVLHLDMISITELLGFSLMASGASC